MDKKHAPNLFSKLPDSEMKYHTRKHPNTMRTDRAITRPSSEPVGMRPIVDRQTPVKTLPSLAVVKNCKH